MSDENQNAIELSDEELDVVVGGFSFESFNATFFEQTDSLIFKNTETRADGSSSTTSLIATRSIRTFAISSLLLGGGRGRRRRR
ncbi:CTB family bacteriocin [Calothrix sp. PCC 7507]|uniref:CTB family bacteriocin n=1 Tax=Calothrix sp. PCC 7507 TaxID=99598 RepID=UPI00029F1451|nr:CTB family bacteriocin [Calothrix sp. PCC 7507]AFY34448.1 hypothetical protein Cal7507_4064 [Calothrix sp. PCC 7507]